MSSRRPTIDSRRSEFKNQGLTQDEFRRRREENSVELRKLKKEDTLNKRRNLTIVQPLNGNDEIPSYSIDSAGSPDINVMKICCFYLFIFNLIAIFRAPLIYKKLLV